ncbi:ABC transporter ATP-binding protein [Streptomyces rimosus]|uniref:ABC transporter ATP-binding protein n=1 Tax=Streptomyces rimosus TaxID=1927 RepID=UPI0006B2A744|nr:ABC transporter ATP-binding protein [Streptomyces rimosus]
MTPPAHGGPEPVITLRGVTHHYPGLARPALDRVSLTVAPGELCGILGRNGAGKTTLVRTMVGALRPAYGEARLYGAPAAEAGAARSSTGYLAQDATPMCLLTPAEAVRLTARLRGLPRAAARDERDALIDWWGLGAFARRRLNHLSGGQRQLALIAMACAGAVSLVILDEPTAGLDPGRRAEVWSRLGELNRSLGRTIVLVTHDPLEAERVLGKVVILVAGRVAAAGRPAELKRRLGSALRVEVVGDGALGPDLPPEYAWDRAGSGLWRTLAEPEAVTGLFQRMGDNGRIADIRVRSANLEDLYFHHAEHH